MNDITNSSYLNKIVENDNLDNEEDFSRINPFKRDKNNKFEKFEKFKPKNNANNKKDPTL